MMIVHLPAALNNDGRWSLAADVMLFGWQVLVDDGDIYHPA